DHTLWFNRIFRATQQQILYSGKWRTMGFALPAAIAAKIAYPDKQVVAIIGDGCFTMSMMELLTAVKYEIPVILIVMHNKTLAMEKHKMIEEGYTPYGVDLVNPNFAGLALSCGAAGFEVHQEQDLLSTLQQAFALEQPVLI
uniref:thiamine pyrophosphate-dependent enzyme n=1 Tax=Proteus mirabilis TaxID=584 RepID=UPI000F2A7FA8